MKVYTALFGVFIGLVATVQIGRAVDPVTGAAMVGTILDSGNKLADLIKKVDDMFLKPITEKVDEEIRKIDTQLDGLTQEEKQLVEDARTKLLQGRYDVSRTRLILFTLADETISRSNTMLRILNIILGPNAATAKQQRGIKLAVRKMTELLTRSKELLAAAKVKYEDVQEQLIIVQVKLQEFAKRVVDMASESNARYKSKVKSLRIKVYGGSAACMIFPPSCAAVYPVAAIVLETKIKEWGDSVKALKEKCAQSNERALEVVTSVKNDIAYIAEEEKLITNWESKISMMYGDYTSGSYAQNAIDMEEFEQNYSVNQLKDLIAACEAYKAHSQYYD